MHHVVMMYTRARGRMLFFFGAALVFIGMGFCLLDQEAFGIVMMVAGVFLMIIGLTILRFHLVMEFRKK